jgi:hypothetical protein
MHQLEIKQNAKVNHKKPKEASAAKRKTAVTAQDHNRPHIGISFSTNMLFTVD